MDGNNIRSDQKRLPEPYKNRRRLRCAIILKLILIIAIVCAIAFEISLFRVNYNFYIVADYPTPTTDILAVKNENALQIPITDTPARPMIYDFTKAVPECAPVPLERFSDVVFIGDSRTAGLVLYTRFNIIDYSAVGLNIGSLDGWAYIDLKNENGQTVKMTCFDALKAQKGQYSAVYITLGLNECGWATKGFEKTYRETIEKLQTIVDVPIYIQLIIPVTTESSNTSVFGITNEKISEFNAVLASIASEYEVYMLDPRDLFTLEDGTLDPEYASDGIHLTRSANKAMVDFYLTHVVNESDYENLASKYSLPAIENDADPEIEKVISE